MSEIRLMSVSYRMHGRKAALLLALIVFSNLTIGSQNEPDEATLKEMRADCHLEAEAGGLRGNELDEFVDQCVEELLTVEIHNLNTDTSR